MAPARTNEGYNVLAQMQALLQQLAEIGEEPRIVGTTIITKSGRVGWSPTK